ncbi:PREDICTED: ribonuclease Z, mitochondrial isoform X2 [Papilio polytes]|uniref:ribonuclease Z, mitochondrial isoform X2 n=1 Tax=Papilio polytes TaxID=76194 RepID=UPI000676269E|nr:PREDICTED: ribonuclease Z, mitochondrial isoform X2 [Papilio polytes]
MLVNFKLQLITSKHMYGKRVLLQSVVRFNNYTVRHYQKKKTQRLLEFLADMPKPNTSRIMDAQRQRQQISKKAQNYVPSTIYLQVVGSGARGVPNTLYLFTDQKRYLFNCGESTQRLAHEHKVKLTRLDHIFITNKTWKNIGGLPGLSLTLQDVGVPNITLHGPQGLDELYKATKRFVIMKDMNVTLAPCSPSEDFTDNVMTVKYVLLRPENILKPDMNPPKKPKLSSDTTSAAFEEFIHDETDYYNPDVRNMEEKKNSKQRNKSPEKESVRKKAERALHELEGKSQCTVAYICTLKKRLGTLDLAKCVEKGVKPGPLLGQLKNGHDVILPDGSHVKSKDVKTPDDPGPVFIVLEVPDISYLTVDDFSSHFDNGLNSMENIPALVVHFTPPHVFRHPIYRMFVSKFGSSTQHLVLNEENSCLGSEAVHRTQHRLHVLDADVFPLLRDATIPAVWNSHPPTDGVLGKANCMEELKNRIAFAQFQNIIRMEEMSKDNITECTEAKYDFITGRTLTIFHLRPKKCLDRSAEPKLHVQDYIKETMEVEGFSKSLEQYREIVSKMGSKKDMYKAEYPKVIFLGTGSCIPSKTRNTSAIVIQIDENRSMLLDCGEGTFGQLVRFFGPKRVNNFLRTLRAVYISHLHADHHMGLIGVVQARREAFSEQSRLPYEPVQLLAPGQIVTWLLLYDQQFENIRDDYALITNQSLLEAKSNSLGTEMTPAALSRIGVQHIRTCLVSHCPNAFGVAIDVDGHHKITYSGDTIPCKELITIGQNSTLLIHEATMEDELAEEARTKMHSTTSQAIQMGRQMCAKYTVLTHFSQRYARLPRLSAHILHDNASVGVAFDNMQIRMKDLELLPYMYAPLQLMFAEHCVELEVKAAHRARRRDRATGSPPPAVRISVTSMKGYGGKERQQTCPGPGRMQRTNEKGKGQPSIYRNTDTPRASDRFSRISNLAKFGTPVREHSGSSTRSVEHRRPYRPASAESSRGALTRDRSASSSKSTGSRGRNQTTFPATCAVNKSKTFVI